MRHFKVTGQDGQDGVLAHEQSTGRAFAYVPQLKTWHRKPAIEAALNGQAPMSDSELVTLEALHPAAAARLLSTLRPADRRKATERASDDAHRAQVRQSGEVLTSAEVGLLSKNTRHKMSRLPLIKDLLEVRSAHKRWTWLYLYEEDGSTRRSAVADLRAKTTLAFNTKGWPLTVQHRKRTVEVNGERRELVVVECKYIKPAMAPDRAPDVEDDGSQMREPALAASVSTGPGAFPGERWG